MPGTTPIYGFPYPDPSDLVANYPALGQQLAEDVETEIAASSKILQVVSTAKTDTFSTSSTSFVGVTGLSATITPSSTASKVLVLVSFMFGSNFNLTQIATQLQRSGSVIFQGDAASTRRRTMGVAYLHGNNNYGSYMHASFLDSPASVSSLSYQLFIAADIGSSTTIYINRGFNDPDATYVSRGASSITLLEVK